MDGSFGRCRKINKGKIKTVRHHKMPGDFLLITTRLKMKQNAGSGSVLKSYYFLKNHIEKRLFMKWEQLKTA